MLQYKFRLTHVKYVEESRDTNQQRARKSQVKGRTISCAVTLLLLYILLCVINGKHNASAKHEGIARKYGLKLSQGY